MPQDDPKSYKMPKIAKCGTKMAHNRQVLGKISIFKIVGNFLKFFENLLKIADVLKTLNAHIFITVRDNQSKPLASRPY